jgi:hypothetical protein
MVIVMNFDDPSELPGAVPTMAAEGAVATANRAPRGRSARRLAALVMLIVVGLAGVLGGGYAMHRELTRSATKAEVATALAAEIASRWERLPAGAIFPATISYTDVAGNTATATLVGIAPRAACRAALEPAGLAHIGSRDCTSMLRATYVSAGGMLAATVGIAVLPSQAAAERALNNLPIEPGAGLYAVPFAGTIASGFTNAARGAAGVQQEGPYLFMYTAGYTDGIPGNVLGTDGSAALLTLGTGILSPLEKTMTGNASPCSMRDISC